MEYKRITERVGKGVAIKETSTNDNKSIWNAIERLAELEDKIEQGKMLELPCKVGDTVWELDLFSKAKIREIKARNLLQILHWIDDESFGKFLFLTKDQAEEKLRELKGGK